MLYAFLISQIFQPPLGDFKNILHPKGLEKGHNGNKPNLSAQNNGYQHGENPFSPMPGFVSYQKSFSELLFVTLHGFQGIMGTHALGTL